MGMGLILLIVKFGQHYAKIHPVTCLEVNKELCNVMVMGLNALIFLVEALYPASVSYPDTEWLIGNHADELVPW